MVICLIASLGLAPTTVPASDASLCVATYNLRFAGPTPPNSWTARRPLIRAVIERIAPDVLGTQEGLYAQLRDVAADLPDYDWIGLGRDGGSRGEFMAVFYRKARLDPLEFEHFWLSDTPEVVGSTTWGNRYRRMVTWVRFRDRVTGKVFCFVNTHFDHEVQAAREKSALLIRDRVEGMNVRLPVVLAGDFNAAAGTNRAFTILTQDDFFRDTWTQADSRHGEGVGTFNDFTAIRENGPRIDWILTRGPVLVERAEVVVFKPQDQWASDHFPVTAVLRFQD